MITNFITTLQFSMSQNFIGQTEKVDRLYCNQQTVIEQIRATSDRYLNASTCRHCILDNNIPLSAAGEQPAAAAATPHLPINHVFFISRIHNIVDPSHLTVEIDLGQNPEVAHIRAEVFHHLFVVGEGLCHRRRPREVQELVKLLRRLELGGFNGPRPDAADCAVSLEDNGVKAFLDQVLAHDKAADSSTDDGHTLLRLHFLFCIPGESGILIVLRCR